MPASTYKKAQLAARQSAGSLADRAAHNLDRTLATEVALLEARLRAIPFGSAAAQRLATERSLALTKQLKAELWAKMSANIRSARKTSFLDVSAAWKAHLLRVADAKDVPNALLGGLKSPSLTMLGAYEGLGGAGGTWATRLGGHVSATADDLDRIIREGLAAHVSPEVMANGLRPYMLGAEELRKAFGGVLPDEALAKLAGREVNLAGAQRQAARKLKYNARRIAYSETHNARAEAEVQSFAADPMITSVRWTLSPFRGQLDGPDECDVLAHADFYGLGPGVFPVGAIPLPPHPFDRCERVPIARPIEEVGTRKPFPQRSLALENVRLPKWQSGRVTADAEARIVGRVGEILAASDEWAAANPLHALTSAALADAQPISSAYHANLARMATIPPITPPLPPIEPIIVKPPTPLPKIVTPPDVKVEKPLTKAKFAKLAPDDMIARAVLGSRGVLSREAILSVDDLKPYFDAIGSKSPYLRYQRKVARRTIEGLYEMSLSPDSVASFAIAWRKLPFDWKTGANVFRNAVAAYAEKLGTGEAFAQAATILGPNTIDGAPFAARANVANAGKVAALAAENEAKFAGLPASVADEVVDAEVEAAIGRMKGIRFGAQSRRKQVEAMIAASQKDAERYGLGKITEGLREAWLKRTARAFADAELKKKGSPFALSGYSVRDAARVWFTNIDKMLDLGKGAAPKEVRALLVAWAQDNGAKVTLESIKQLGDDAIKLLHGMAWEDRAALASWKEVYDAKKKVARLGDALVRAKDVERRRMLAALAPTEEGVAPAQVIHGATSTAQAKADETASFYERMFHPRTRARREAISSNMGVKQNVKFHGSRASYDDSFRQMNVSAKNDGKTWAHEMGHWWEYRIPEIHDAMIAFRERRTVGEVAVTLKTLFPIYNYKAKEITKPDSFFHPYVGKIYGHKASEVFTMGMQELFDDPISFWEKDPDHFRAILAALRGKGWRLKP